MGRSTRQFAASFKDWLARPARDFVDRRSRDGRCIVCGYDIRSLPHPTCPECGTDCTGLLAALHADEAIRRLRDRVLPPGRTGRCALCGAPAGAAPRCPVCASRFRAGPPPPPGGAGGPDAGA